MSRKNKIIIIIVLILLLAAVGLFIAAQVKNAQKEAPSGSPNATQQVLPATVPDQLSSEQKDEAAAVAKLFLEVFGSYNENSQLKNFNSAAAYATNALRVELDNFRKKVEADLPDTFEPLLVNTKAQVQKVEVVTDPDGHKRVLAYVKGTISTTKNDLTRDQDFTGTLSMIVHGKIWFVDDMDITPDFLGFK